MEMGMGEGGGNNGNEKEKKKMVDGVFFGLCLWCMGHWRKKKKKILLFLGLVAEYIYIYE